MQDLSTGEMRMLDPKFFEGLEKAASPADKHQLCHDLSARIQQACDAVQPDRSKQGPVFRVGEILEIRGGKFQITRIEPGHLRLKSLPSNPKTTTTP